MAHRVLGLRIHLAEALRAADRLEHGVVAEALVATRRPDEDAIDPALFFDDDGSAWIVNNGPPEGEPRYTGHRAIWIQRFDARTKATFGPRKVLVDGGVVPASGTGIPGFVAGMASLHEAHGEADWAEVLAPAIELAAGGAPYVALATIDELHPDRPDRGTS